MFSDGSILTDETELTSAIGHVSLDLKGIDEKSYQLIIGGNTSLISNDSERVMGLRYKLNPVF